MKDWKFYAHYVKEHPPYSGIHDKEQSKSRRKKMRKFKKKYGFEYSDIWNLDHTIISFLLPRLAFFVEKHTGFPCSLDQMDENGKISNEQELIDEYQKKLETIVEGFYLYANRESFKWSDEEEVVWTLAKQYFMELFESLWD